MSKRNKRKVGCGVSENTLKVIHLGNLSDTKSCESYKLYYENFEENEKVIKEGDYLKIENCYQIDSALSKTNVKEGDILVIYNLMGKNTYFNMIIEKYEKCEKCEKLTVDFKFSECYLHNGSYEKFVNSLLEKGVL